MSFNPDQLKDTSGGGQPQTAKVKSERLFVAISEYQTPDAGFHYAVGNRLDTGEPVRVRLTTVKERSEDRPKDDPAKIEKAYASGDNHRESIADKAKSNIKLISFDDARLVSNEGGVAEYRAHWPKTISTKPDAEVLMGLGHVRLRDGNDNTRSQAYVELLKNQVSVTKDNVDSVLADALSLKDDSGRARDPFAVVRIAYNGEVVSTGRIYPATVEDKKFDQTLGDFKTIKLPATADVTLSKLMSGEPGRDARDTLNADKMRAVIAGVKGEGEPVIASPGQKEQDTVRNLYFGAKSGDLQIEVISAEKIDFGADSRKTYLAEKDRPQLSVYNVKEHSNGHDYESPGFTQTAVGIHRHPDGEAYAVFAAPVESYPRPVKLAQLPLSAAPAKELDNSAEKKLEASASLEM